MTKNGLTNDKKMTKKWQKNDKNDTTKQEWQKNAKPNDKKMTDKKMTKNDKNK